jgi:hypothetical protein
MAMVTGLWRANGDVQEVEGTAVKRWVHREREGMREATGHGGALTRPGMPSCASWRAAGRVWACLGARGLGGVDVNLVNGLQEQLQEGQGKSMDKVVWLGWERRGGEHVG